MTKTIRLAGEIADFDYHGPWGDFTSPRTVLAALKDLADDDCVIIDINSPGGLCIPGIEIANAIKNAKQKCVAHVTGIAASMASVIACACDEIKMEEASFMMIHDPWSFAEGNAEQMRKEADNLDQFKAVIMSFYRGKFERSEEEISQLMSDETWMTGKECLANGLKCTVIASDVRAAASISNHHFKKLPEGAAAFLAAKEVTDEGRAEIEAARAAAKAEAEAEAAAREQTAAAEPAAAPVAEGNWEARYKGLSKKLNESHDALAAAEQAAAAAEAARATAETSLAEAQAKIADLSSKLELSAKDLADANAKVSSLSEDLEKANSDLAQAREHAEHLEKTRAIITGGVLTPPEAGSSYAEQMKSAKTPEAREKLRAMKKAGKIN